jgi:hypothetical protein
MFEKGQLHWAVEDISKRLAEVASITLSRAEVTAVWRAGAMRCFAEEWKANPPTEIDGDRFMVQIRRFGRLRMSKGTAMRLTLALSEQGIGCAPPLERLVSMSHEVRIHHK